MSVSYKGKYKIYTRKKTKKERLNSAAKRGINTGITSGVLTGVLNTGKGKWKAAGKFGLFLGGAVTGLDYMSTRKGNRNRKTFVKKADHVMQKIGVAGAVVGGVGKGLQWTAKKVLPKTKLGKAWGVGDILAPGRWAAKKMGVKTKPNLFDDFVLMGAPITAGLMAHKNKNPERYAGTPEGKRATEKKWEARGQKGIKHSVLAGY